MGTMIKRNQNDINIKLIKGNMLIFKNIKDVRAFIGHMLVFLWFSSYFVKHHMFQENRCSHIKQYLTLYHFYLLWSLNGAVKVYNHIYIKIFKSKRHMLMLLYIYWNLIITICFLFTFVILLPKNTISLNRNVMPTFNTWMQIRTRHKRYVPPCEIG